MTPKVPKQCKPWKDEIRIKSSKYSHFDVPAAYWHAIMHRREPDAANSKYWFRRVGSHPVIALLVEQAPALGYDYTSPQAFVDFCEKARDSGTAEEVLARRVQMLEWQLLFKDCFQKAVSQ